MPLRQRQAWGATACRWRAEKQIVAGSKISAVISALEQTLIDHLHTDGFSIKLDSFGKFKIRHKPSIYRKISFTGETKLIEPKREVKFVALGKLRALERCLPDIKNSSWTSVKSSTQGDFSAAPAAFIVNDAKRVTMVVSDPGLQILIVGALGQGGWQGQESLDCIRSVSLRCS